MGPMKGRPAGPAGAKGSTGSSAETGRAGVSLGKVPTGSGELAGGMPKAPNAADKTPGPCILAILFLSAKRFVALILACSYSARPVYRWIHFQRTFGSNVPIAPGGT